VTGSGALAAGWLLVLSTIAFAAVGTLLGSLVDARFFGGLIGGIIGTVLGFIIVWKRYVVPANEEDAHRDYSRIRPIEDDDDDDW
jgi:F0F1-type ATP synthase assembly protein I